MAGQTSPNNGSAIVAVCHPARQGIQRTVPTEATAPRARRAAAAANKRHVRLKAQRRLAQTSPRSAAAAAHAAANSLNNPVDGFARMPKMSSGRPSEKSASTSPHREAAQQWCLLQRSDARGVCIIRPPRPLSPNWRRVLQQQRKTRDSIPYPWCTPCLLEHLRWVALPISRFLVQDVAYRRMIARVRQ